MIAMMITDLFKLSGLCKSRNEALSLIQQRGLYIDGDVVETSKMLVNIEEPMVLQRGKKKFVRVMCTEETLKALEETAIPICFEEEK